MKNMKKLIIQLFNFGIVGVICFGIEYGCLILFKEYALPAIVADKSSDFYTLAATPLAFTISVICNYILSMKFVFKKRENVKSQEVFLIFVILNIIALGLNELWMWLFSSRLNIDYRIAKLIATTLVMIYNFISRKIFVEDHSDKEKKA